ncbi:MAG: 16S rRNA (guanine(966)-N(2))-methyltransferase RsmD [Granulosicoccus sp.]
MMCLLFKTRYRNTVASSFRRSHRGAGKSGHTARSQAAGQVRIIAGRWRGRKLSVPDVAGLRPTGERVRETVFNWLQAHVAGSHCLDLFAGSGALGFEALSRSAQSVTFVEPDTVAMRNLNQSCQLLDITLIDNNEPAVDFREVTAAKTCLYTGTAQQALKHWSHVDEIPKFDLVFIDPPFKMGCQWDMLAQLVPALLADAALVYIESPFTQLPPEELPDGCEIVREKRFGDVTARLVRFTMTA